jgi:ferritin-like metal-binding protein YciE
MGLFGREQFASLQDLLFHQLEDLYDAEQRLVEALPEMKEAAHNTELKTAIADHHRETQNHVERLKQIFKVLGKEPQSETCPAMQGLIKEAREMVQAQGDAATCDAALIAAAQRVEHYEMAGYGTVRDLAEQLGNQDAAQQAQANLEEEKGADDKLTQIAQRINAAAAKAG